MQCNKRQDGPKDMTAVDPQILSAMTHAMRVPIGRLGGAFVWPSLLHKLERENTDHKLCALRGPPVRPVLCFSLRKGLHVLLSGPEGRIQSVCGLCNGALTAKVQGCLRRCLIFFARSLFCVTKLRFIKAGSSAVLLRLEGLGSRPFLSSSLRSVPSWLWNLEVSNSRQGIFLQEPTSVGYWRIPRLSNHRPQGGHLTETSLWRCSAPTRAIRSSSCWINRCDKCPCRNQQSWR